LSVSQTTVFTLSLPETFGFVQYGSFDPGVDQSLSTVTVHLQASVVLPSTLHTG
jgi:hypothetical protein